MLCQLRRYHFVPIFKLLDDQDTMPWEVPLPPELLAVAADRGGTEWRADDEDDVAVALKPEQAGETGPTGGVTAYEMPGGAEVLVVKVSRRSCFVRFVWFLRLRRCCFSRRRAASSRAFPLALEWRRSRPAPAFVLGF